MQPTAIIDSQKKDITQHEIHALKTTYNLADAHTHQSQSPSQRRIVENLPNLWYSAENQTQYASEQEYIETFYRFHGQHTALERREEIYLVYAASIAMHITATYMNQRKMRAGLIEPCFDNLHDLMKHMQIPMSPLGEHLFSETSAVYRNLEKHAAELDAIVLVDPNNPTGFSIFADGAATFKEIVRYCVDHKKLLVLDLCFAPRRVDVLISEIIGNLADNEDFQPVLQDAIARFLAPDGVALPRSTRSFLVPVCAPEAHHAVRDGQIATLTPRYDIDSLYRDKGIQSPFNLYYDCIVPRSTYLGRPAQVCHYQGAWDQAATYTRELQFTIERGGTLTGFKGYFVAELSRSTVLDISGDEIEAGLCSDSWKHAYLPIERPLDVREGDTLALSFSRQRGAGAFRQLYGWRGSVARGQQRIAEFTQHMSES